MKKFVSLVLVFGFGLSVFGCYGDRRSGSRRDEEDEEEEETEVVETSAETTADETTVSTSAPTETEPSPTPSPTPVPVLGDVSSYVECVDHDIEVSENYGDVVYEYTIGNCVPRLLIDSDYADEVNAEIDEVMESLEDYIDENGGTFFYGTGYATQLSEEGCLTIVMAEFFEADDTYYHVYNINVFTGEEFTNEEMAAVGGIDSVRETAMFAAQNYINNYFSGFGYEGDVVADFALNPDCSEAESLAGWGFDWYIESTFAEDNIYDEMMMGLTDSSEVFFVSRIATMGGSGFYYQFYDASGNDIKSQLEFTIPENY